jgi:hypothetical protein
MRFFTPAAIELTGRIVLSGDVDRIFPLFSPLGEKQWVPGWDPRIVHPAGAEWEEKMIFLTREESGEAAWYVTRLDRASHEVVYHRLEPLRYVARVEVRCREAWGGRTEATVKYSFTGLSEDGNREISAVTQAAYDAKMGRWKEWLRAALGRM